MGQLCAANLHAERPYTQRMLSPEEALSVCTNVLPELTAINRWMQRHYVCEDNDVAYDSNIVAEHADDPKKVCVMQPFPDCDSGGALLEMANKLRGVANLNKCEDVDLVEFYLCLRYVQQCCKDVPVFCSVSADLARFFAYSLECVVVDLDLCRMSDLGEKKRERRGAEADCDDGDDSDFVANDSEEIEEEEGESDDEDEEEARFSDEEDEDDDADDGEDAPPHKRTKLDVSG